MPRNGLKCLSLWLAFYIMNLNFKHNQKIFYIRTKLNMKQFYYLFIVLSVLYILYCRVDGCDPDYGGCR